MKHIIITAFLFGGMLFKTQAQEFTVGINAAQAGASYQLPNGKVQMKPSFGGEIGLQVPLGKHFQILSGLELFQYQSKATLADNQVYTHNEVDDMGSSFEYRVITSGYTETQSVTALRIPLILQLTTGSLEKTQWYFNAGGKFMLPGRINVKANAVKLTTTGYYPDVNAEVHSLPQHGFGDVNNWQSNGTYSVKSGWLLSGGTGFSFKLTPSGKTRLYAGLYADFGLSNLKVGKESLSIITYNSQNVVNVQANGTMGMNEVTNLKLMNFGVQLKLGFGHKQKGKKISSTPKLTSKLQKK
jgi:OmpA-OmpF porin, OOP family